MSTSAFDASRNNEQAAHVFTSRLWVTFGTTCLLTLALGALLFHDPFSVIVIGFQAAAYLFVCFIGLTLLSFIPRPPLHNPALQATVFIACLAISGATYATASAAVRPFLGQPADFEFYPAYYLYCLPVLGLTMLTIAAVHLLSRSRTRRNQQPASPTPDHADQPHPNASI